MFKRACAALLRFRPQELLYNVHVCLQEPVLLLRMFVLKSFVLHLDMSVCQTSNIVLSLNPAENKKRTLISALLGKIVLRKILNMKPNKANATQSIQGARIPL